MKSKGPMGEPEPCVKLTFAPADEVEAVLEDAQTIAKLN
jgi:hypothetical protein